MLSGTPDRAVVVHSSAPDTRRQPRLARASQASYRPVQTAARPAAHQEDCCRADADAAAAPRRAVHPAYPLLEVTVEARPVSGRGRPRPQKPRPVTALRSRLQPTIRPHPERIVRLEEEAGCCVLLTTVPPGGDLAQSARDLLTGDTDHQGTEQHDGFLTAPVLVKSLFLKQPERIEAVGLVVGLARLMWRWMERALRTPGDTTSTSWPGWDKQATERPTSCRMVTQCPGVIVLKRGPHRPLARSRWSNSRL